MRSLWICLVVSLMLALSGCETVTDSTIAAHLESLQLTPGMTRPEVIGRLGEPPFIYEKERIMSYPIYEWHGQLYKEDPGGVGTTMQLMLKFSKDWKVERTSVIRRPFYFFQPAVLE